jgi:hypothetical protein
MQLSLTGITADASLLDYCNWIFQRNRLWRVWQAMQMLNTSVMCMNKFKKKERVAEDWSLDGK